MLKNKILSIAFAVVLAMPVCVFAENENPPFEEIQPAQANTLDEKVPQESNIENIPPIETIGAKNFKQPVSKKKIIKKFLLAMVGVGVSSLTIYFGLTLYNKFRDGIAVSNQEDKSLPESAKLLDTPDSLSEAVKTFIDKTKWE